MKRKIMFLLALLFVGISVVNAQARKVTGHVYSAEDKEPIVGATILVVGTTQGTITGLDGDFILGNVPASATTLRVSYVGMKSKDVKIKPNLEIYLDSDAELLEEVVVTAMGIKRSEKALGYSATSVSNEEISETRSSDMMSGLQGKIAGVQINTTSSDPGASNSVVIRGVSSLSGSNQPLYVVDGVPIVNSSQNSTSLNGGYDFGNGANMVNPDDVANMTVLKGAAATALYGSRAANGVILITTKSGKKQKKGLGVEYNGGMTFASVLRLPQMQNKFGMGWDGHYTQIENGSWGPRMDGSMQLWGTVYENSQKLKAFSPKEDNLEEFFDTGVTYNNSVSFNGADDNSSYFVSMSQVSNDGILPTSADSYDKYTFSARGNRSIGDLTVSTSVNYSTQKNDYVATGQGLSMINSLIQMPRDISYISLEDQSDIFNTPGYYYTPYGVTNPYFVLNNYKNTYKAEKIYGKVQLDYNFLDHFTATYRIGLDSSYGTQKYGSPNMKSLFAGTPNDVAGVFDGETGTVYIRNTHNREVNSDALLSYNNRFGEFDINGLLGFNYNERIYRRDQSTVKNLDLPTFYNLSNSAATPTVSEYEYRRRLYGFFGQADIGWRNMAYLTVSARNDWSSTLPEDDRSFFYSGVTGSFIVSEILPEDVKEVVSFAQVRAAYGQTGNDADPYQIDAYYVKSAASSGFADLSFPLGGVNAFTLGNTLGNINLQPEITTEFEFGAKVALWNGRVSLDASYYNRNSDKQIFSLDMDPASGYTAQSINLGKIENKGIELLFSVQPIKTKDFLWEITMNYTKNNSEVVSLPEELGGVAQIGGLTSAPMFAIVGEPAGVIKTTVPVYDDQGRIVVDKEGLPVESTDKQAVGDVNYDYELGLGTTLKYKGLSLGIDFDIRHGGVMYSRTKDTNWFTGNDVHTLYNDRNTFIVPNSVQKVTAQDGTVSYVENATPIAQDKLGEYFDNGADKLGSAWIIDRSYVKLRSVVLGYELPKSLFRDLPIQGVKVSVYGNNLFLWTPDDNTYVDPESSTFGNDFLGRYGEFSANPSTRRFGFNLNVKF